MRRLLIGIVGGAVACGAVIGFTAMTGAGADLLRVLHLAALVFFLAGAAAGGGRSSAALGATMLGGCAPVIGLSLAGVAFNTLVWSGSFVATVCVAAPAGALARRSWGAGAPRRSLVIAVISGLVVVGGLQLAVPRLLRGAALDRGSRSIPPIALVGADGGPISSAGWTGKVVVLAFWGTWCKPCQAELPELERLNAHYRGNPRVELRWVNAGLGGDTLAIAADFARAHPDLPLAFSDGGAAMDALGLSGLPALAVIDPAGRLRVTHRGFDRSEGMAALLEGEIDRLLAEP